LFPARFGVLIGVGFAAVAALIPDGEAVAQSPTASPVSESTSSGAPRILPLHEGKFSIDLSRYPVSGSVSAKNVVVIISDFTCPHCRDTEKAFIDALDGFKAGEVALVHLPGTRETKDGPAIHKIMLSLWQEHPAIYRRLCAQMIYEELPAEPDKVRAAAVAALGGPAVLDGLIKKHSAWAEAQIEQASKLMTANADSPARVLLPQVMVGTKLITGSVLNPAELQNNIQEQFGVVPVHFVYAVSQVPTDPDDPCEPSRRKSCGRVVISIIGAGEVSTNPAQSIDASVLNDTHAACASAHLLQFTGDSNAKLPSKHIVFTSDPEFKAWLSKLPFTAKASLAGVVDASLPAFHRMSSSGSENSPLNQAITSFENTAECKELMNGGPSVLPYLKVDIIIDAEFAEGSESGHYGVPVWRREGTVGTLDKWASEGTVLGADDLSLLLQRLSGSLTHVLIKSCKAALIGNIFDRSIEEAGSCDCALSVSDEIQDSYSGGATRPPFNYAMPDKGNLYKKIKVSQSFGRWADNRMNLAEMGTMLLNQHDELIMNPLDPSDPDSAALKRIVQHKNPLFGFAYTSADAQTNRLLALLRENPSTAEAARVISDSEFTSEIRKVHVPQYTRREVSTALEIHIARIKERLDSIKKQLGPMIDRDPKSKLDSSAYTREVENFRSCLLNTNHASLECSFFKAMTDSIRETNVSKAELSSDQTAFLYHYSELVNYLNEIKFKTMWPRYIAGEIAANEFSEKMGKAKLRVLEFQRGIEPLYAKKPGKRLSQREAENLEKKRQAFAYLNHSFESAFNSAKTQMFDQLKKESITTKLLRTEAAVDLLAANIDSIKPAGEGEKLIARLASKLNCLTRYKVGPAHDQQPPGPIIPYQAKR
jgi:hypothetical protein